MSSFLWRGQDPFRTALLYSVGLPLLHVAAVSLEGMSVQSCGWNQGSEGPCFGCVEAGIRVEIFESWVRKTEGVVGCGVTLGQQSYLKGVLWSLFYVACDRNPLHVTS